MDTPPPIPPRPPGYEIRVPANPPLPPRQTGPSQSQHQEYDAPPRPQAAAWGPLTNLDGTPTPLMESLMAAFFARLDPQGTGVITPETLSYFLDVNGFPTEDNVCKCLTFSVSASASVYHPSTFLLVPSQSIPAYLLARQATHPTSHPIPSHRIPPHTNQLTTQPPTREKNLRPSAMFAAEDIADFELKAACEAWPFEHRIAIRHPGAPHQLPYGGMPLLTQRGFTAMLAVDTAGDPDRGHRGLVAALRHYGVWADRGPLPRACLLPGPDMPAPLRRRVDEVMARAARVAAQRIEATRVRMEVQAQGRRNAEELSGDYYYVRRDY
ncbi:hypothetical protein GGR54DRAFT_309242 [Hypoxylon sp. NC1633]|nr:hypothetical protein GGR54DRAFT_309242 [Hypoxylon sp. NC1633]